ncbi:MAG: LPS assembly lipoprotein LptE [Arcobacteraceae bacterium]
MKVLVSLFLIVGLFIGCGYKPSSYYARDAITGDVYVVLNVDIENSENSVYVKDAMNEMIINQFKTSITDDKAKADTVVTVALSSVSHTAMSTDADGYAQSYRTTVNIVVSYQKNGEKSKSVSVSNYYDYSVDTDSIITDQKKKVAVKIASTKALSDIFSKIAINSMKE